MLKNAFLAAVLFAGTALGQTTTTYQLALGSTVIGSYATQALAQAAAQAHGAGSYAITPDTLTIGTPVTYVVSATSPDNTVITAPTTATISALGHVIGITGGQITVDGVVDPSTHAVQQGAWESGELWQSSTNIGGTVRWWGTTVIPAVWLPAGGTTTSPIPNSGTTGQVTRPSYNTGVGFFVLGGKLYDANGNEFRIRGVDRNHYDSPSQPGISIAGPNAVRMFLYTLGSGMAAKYSAELQTQMVAYKEVPIPVMSLFPDGTTASCNSNPTELATGVAWWVANAASFKGLEKYYLLNIANEWGPSNSAAWATAYESAIKSLRAAGYLGTLVIDSGGCGQDMADLVNYSTAVFNSDPQKNVLFSLHVYGNIPTASVAPDLLQLATLGKNNGAAYAALEFGPGRNLGPSPTLTTPTQVVQAAEAAGLGWGPWAWDSNDLAGGASDNNSFSMTLQGPGYYTGLASQLTTYGQWGVSAWAGQLPGVPKAVPATIFQ